MGTVVALAGFCPAEKPFRPPASLERYHCPRSLLSPGEVNSGAFSA